MKDRIKVVAGILFTVFFILAMIVSIRASVSISNINSIMLATLCFLATCISGSSTHLVIDKIINNKNIPEMIVKSKISENLNKFAA